MHVSRKVPTYIVVRTGCAQSKEALRIVREFRPDAAEIEPGVPVQGSFAVFYVSPVALRQVTRLGKRPRRSLSRLSSAAELVQELDEKHVPLEVRSAHSCVAIQPLSPGELSDSATLKRLRDSLQQRCRTIQLRAQQADHQSLCEAKKARREAEVARRAEAEASEHALHGRPLWALEA